MTNVHSDSHTRVRINAEIDVARAIAHANRMSAEAKFRAVDQSRIATAVSELARNILKYASHGEITLSQVADGARRGLEVVAEDRGPGIEDMERAQADHFSSGGTLGLGLPGVKRLMDEFTLDSEPGAGTRVRCRIWLQPARP